MPDFYLLKCLVLWGCEWGVGGERQRENRELEMLILELLREGGGRRNSTRHEESRILGAGLN